MGMQKKKDDTLQSDMEALKQGKFDKLRVPEGFVGTFQDLFELLLSSYGTIAIGLHR